MDIIIFIIFIIFFIITFYPISFGVILTSLYYYNYRNNDIQHLNIPILC